MLKYNPNNKNLAKQLRRNQTRAERLLWNKLRRKQIKNLQFYRQKPIGNYIADFYCPRIKLIIEVDGDRHYTEKSKQYDLKREEYLKGLGIKVYRINNIDIYKNLKEVVDGIWLVVEELISKNLH